MTTLRKAVKQMVDSQRAEEATGCRQHPKGLGKFYRKGGIEVTPAQAKGLLLEGEAIEVPNAGAGSYSYFFQACGFEETEVIEQCSSAGNWTFAVKLGAVWYPAWQTNRYPHFGYSYAVNETISCISAEAVAAILGP